MMRFTFLLMFSLFSIALFSCSDGNGKNNVAVKPINSAPAQSPLPKATIDELASGRTLYASNCANCHKENGTGGEVVVEGRKMKPDDLTTAKIKGFSDDKIIGFMMNGIQDEGMPALKGKISEGEMRDIVKFIRVELQKAPSLMSPKS